MYPLVIQHSHGKWFIFRWFSQLETPIYFGDFPYVSHNQMVSLLKKTNGQRLTQKRGEVVVKIDESDCDFLNTFPHEKFWGLFSQKNTRKMHEKKWLDSNPQSSSMWWIEVTSLKSTQRNVCLLGRTPPNRWPWKNTGKRKCCHIPMVDCDHPLYWWVPSAKYIIIYQPSFINHIPICLIVQIP